MPEHDNAWVDSFESAIQDRICRPNPRKQESKNIAGDQLLPGVVLYLSSSIIFGVIWAWNRYCYHACEADEHWDDFDWDDTLFEDDIGKNARIKRTSLENNHLKSKRNQTKSDIENKKPALPRKITR